MAPLHGKVAHERAGQAVGRPPSPRRTGIFRAINGRRCGPDTPLTLTLEDLRKLQSTNDPISLDEVIAIYLPLSRLLALYVAATQGLFKATQRFSVPKRRARCPTSSASRGRWPSGNPQPSRVMQALLSRWPNTPKVELVTRRVPAAEPRAARTEAHGAQGVS